MTTEIEITQKSLQVKYRFRGDFFSWLIRGVGDFLIVLTGCFSILMMVPDWTPYQCPAYVSRIEAISGVFPDPWPQIAGVFRLFA